MLTEVAVLLGCEAEAEMDNTANEQITSYFSKENLSNIQQCVEECIKKWQVYCDFYPGWISNKEKTFEHLIRMTAKVVFHGKYTKCVPSETKERLRSKIKECGFKLEDLPRVLLLWSFCDIIIDPWTKYIGMKTITAEDADSIWKEGWILLDERLDTLISTKMFDQAANILEICISKGQIVLKSASQDTIEIFHPFVIQQERLLQYMIIYVFLWSRNSNKHTSFRSWLSPMLREVVNFLYSSEEETKDRQRLYPKLKEWKKMKKIGAQFVLEVIWLHLKRPNTDSETLCHMMDVSMKYGPADVGENPSDIPLVKNILSRITEIASSTYLYLLADVIKKNKLRLSEKDMKAKVIEIYIRAMTIDMASIDALKSLTEVDKQRVIELQKQLSEKYEELEKYFPNHPATSFQFLLTAHCLCPQKHLFQSLFPETYSNSDSSSNKMTNIPKTMNNAEELQLPELIWEDLVTLVWHPRWKSICGWTSDEELKAMCKKFLQTGIDSLIGEKELEYLNLNSEKFKNLKSSTEHEEDDCVENGYRIRDKRKPRRVKRKSKIIEIVVKNNQQNSKAVPKIIDPLYSASTDPELSSQVVITEEDIVQSQSDFEPVWSRQEMREIEILGISGMLITEKMAKDVGRSISFSMNLTDSHPTIRDFKHFVKNVQKIIDSNMSLSANKLCQQSDGKLLESSNIADSEKEDYSYEVSSNEFLMDLGENCFEETPLVSIEPKETISDNLDGLPVLYPISPPRKRRKNKSDFGSPPTLDCFKSGKKLE